MASYEIVYFFLSTLMVVSAVEKVGVLHWEYEGEAEERHHEAEGPAYWAKKFPVCDDTHQSPIDVDGGAVVVQEFPELELGPGFGKTMTYQILNTGHTVRVKPEVGRDDMWVRGARLRGQFDFLQMHLHFGAHDDEGSEHTLNGASFAAEAHMVFRSANKSSTAEAMQDPHGFAVLSTWISVVSKQQPDKKVFSADVMENIRYYDEEAQTDIRLSDYISSNRSAFIRYHGSLTTPPCAQSVDWTIFVRPIEITPIEMRRLREALTSGASDKEPVHMYGNFRPPQPLSRRTVYATVGLPSPSSDGPGLKASLYAFAAAFLLATVRAL